MPSALFGDDGVPNFMQAAYAGSQGMGQELADSARQSAAARVAAGDYQGAARALIQAGDPKASQALMDTANTGASLDAAGRGDVLTARTAAARTGNPDVYNKVDAAAVQARQEQLGAISKVVQVVSSYPEAPGDATGDPSTPRAQALQRIARQGLYAQTGTTPEMVQHALAGPLDNTTLSKTTQMLNAPFSGVVHEKDRVYQNGNPVAEGYVPPVLASAGQAVIGPDGKPGLQVPFEPKVTFGKPLETPYITGGPQGGAGAGAPGAPRIAGGSAPPPPNVTPSPAGIGQVHPTGGVKESMGDRNNNPGNVLPSPTGTWQGQTGVDPKSGYAVFDNAQDGARALDLNLQAYARHGIATPMALVQRWASTSPAAEKQAYAQRVNAAVGPNFDLNDPAVRAKVAQAIATSEGTHLSGAPGGGAPSASAPAASAQPNAALPPGVQVGTQIPAQPYRIVPGPNGVTYKQSPNGDLDLAPGSFTPSTLNEIYTRNTKDLAPYTDAIPLLKAARGAAREPSGAGDISLVESTARLFNPRAAVRQGTMKMFFDETQGIPDMVMGAFNQLNSGAKNARLSPDTRAALLRMAEQRVQILQQSAAPIIAAQNAYAKRNNLNPADILPPIESVGPRTPSLDDINAALAKRGVR